MKVPQYQQRVGVPRLREQVNVEAAQMGAIARFGESVTAVGADIATRIAGAIKSKEINKALTDAKESWYEFARGLETDPDYSGYAEKFNDYKKKLQEDLTGEMKLPASRRAFNERFEPWAIDRQEDITQLARQKFLVDARSNFLRDVNQDVRDLDETAFNTRIDEAIADGIINPEDGEKIRLTEGVKIRTGKVKNIARDYGYEKGIAELNQNRDYYQKTYDLTDDEISKIVSDLQFEQKTEQAQIDFAERSSDEANDVLFSDLHIKADTIEAVEQAVAKLTETHYFDGNQKYQWEQRFQAKAEYILRGMDLSEDGTKALKAEQDKYYDHLLARVTRKRREGASDEKIYKELVYPSYWHYTKDGVRAPLISGDQYSKLEKDLEAEDNAAFDAAMEYIYTKGAGLTDEEQMIADKDFRLWWRTSTDTSPEKAIQAAQNIVDPAVAKSLEQLVDRAINYNLRGPKRLSKLEKMIQAVEAGGLVGLAQVIGEDLALYGAAMVELARREHPEEEISVAFPDTGGQYGAPEGTPILTNAAKQVYIFKMEDKEAVLYKLGRNKAGAYEWQRLDTSAEVKTQLKEEAQIIRTEEQEQERADDLRAVEDLFEGKTAGLDLADWKRVGLGWTNKETGEMADARTIMTLNRLVIFKDRK